MACPLSPSARRPGASSRPVAKVVGGLHDLDRWAHIGRLDEIAGVEDEIAVAHDD